MAPFSDASGCSHAAARSFETVRLRRGGCHEDARLAPGVRRVCVSPSVDTSTCELREAGKQTKRNPRKFRISELVRRVARCVIVSMAVECRICDHHGGSPGAKTTDDRSKRLRGQTRTSPRSRAPVVCLSPDSAALLVIEATADRKPASTRCKMCGRPGHRIKPADWTIAVVGATFLGLSTVFH